MKDHELAKLTNDLRDIAIKYGHTEQLREQIAHRLHPEIIRLRAELAASKELNKKLQSLVDAGLLVNSTSEARHRRELTTIVQAYILSGEKIAQLLKMERKMERERCATWIEEDDPNLYPTASNGFGHYTPEMKSAYSRATIDCAEAIRKLED